MTTVFYNSKFKAGKPMQSPAKNVFYRQIFIVHRTRDCTYLVSQYITLLIHLDIILHYIAVKTNKSQ